MEEEWPERCIVFANTKHKCEDIWGYLAADGHRVGLLTGDVAQKNAFHCSNNLPMVSLIFSWQLMLQRVDCIFQT